MNTYFNLLPIELVKLLIGFFTCIDDIQNLIKFFESLFQQTKINVKDNILYVEKYFLNIPTLRVPGTTFFYNLITYFSNNPKLSLYNELINFSRLEKLEIFVLDQKYIDDIGKLTNLKYLEIVYDSHKNKLDFLPIIKEYVTLIIRTLENASILTINKNIAHIYSNLHLCCKLQFIKELYIHNDGIVELVINYKSRKNMPNIIFNRVYLIMDNYRIPMNAIFYAIAELDDTRSNIKTQKLVVEGLNDENIEKLGGSLSMFTFKFSYIKF